jgi:hypothetical protein
MTRDQIIESIARCEREAKRCAELSGDKSLTMNDRLGAQGGELDWLSAKQLFEEDLQKLAM